MTNIFLNLFILLISIIISLLLCEIFARKVFPPEKAVYQYSHEDYFWDHDLGNFRIKPGTISSWDNGYNYEDIFTDKHSFRTIKQDMKNEEIQDIFVVGDSQSFGHGLPYEKSWVYQLSLLLNEKINNSSFPGYGPFQYEKIILKYLNLIKNRTIIMGITDNDLCSARETEFKPHDKELLEKYIFINKSEYFLETPIKFIRYYTGLGKMIYSSLKKFQGTKFGSLIYKKYYRSKEYFINNPLHNGECKISFINWISKISNLANNNNIDLIILIIPHPQRPMNMAVGKHNKHYEGLIKEIENLSKENKFKVIDTLNVLMKQYKNNNFRRTSLLLPIDDHYGIEGNQIIANILYENYQNK